MIKLRQSNQNIRRDISRSVFIPKILGLFHAQIFSHLLLCHIMILTQVSNPPI